MDLPTQSSLSMLNTDRITVNGVEFVQAEADITSTIFCVPPDAQVHTTNIYEEYTTPTKSCFTLSVNDITIEGTRELFVYSPNQQDRHLLCDILVIAPLLCAVVSIEYPRIGDFGDIIKVCLHPPPQGDVSEWTRTPYP
jgi:hypothetical protein